MIEEDNGTELPARLRLRFHYLVFKLDVIAPMLEPPDEENRPGAYLAEDATSKALKDALAKGYRWTRTDGDNAIFEKITLRLPLEEKEQPE